MKIKIIVYTTILLLTCIYINSYGQTAKSDSAKIPGAYWVALGFGPSSLGSLSGTLNASVEIPHRWVITGNWQNEINNLFNRSSSHSLQVNTYNLLAGKIYKRKYSFATVSAGVALVNVISYDGYFDHYTNFVETNNRNRFTIGIPIIVQGYLVALQALGLGISVYANLNTIRPTAGFTANLALGRMATHKRRRNY